MTYYETKIGKIIEEEFARHRAGHRPSQRKNLRAQIISLFFQGGSFSTPFFQKGGKNFD